MNTTFRACLASIDRRVKVPPAPRALYPAPTTLLPDGKPPRHSRAAVWLAPETLLPLCPIEKRRHILRPVLNELRAYRAAIAMRRGTPFQLPAFDAVRSSFLPSPDAREQSQDKQRAKYQSIVLRATHWRGQGNTRY